MKPLSESSFNKWRCLIALAFIDKKLQPAEKNFFLERLKNLTDEAITEKHMTVFQQDFSSPKNPKMFFEKIKDPNDLIDLLQLLYELFWIDGEYAQPEKRMFKTLKSYIARQLHINQFELDDIAKGRKKVPVFVPRGSQNLDSGSRLQEAR